MRMDRRRTWSAPREPREALLRSSPDMTVRQLGGHYATVVEALEDAARLNPEVEAYVELASSESSGLVPDSTNGTRRMTFAQWEAGSARLATGFAALGVRRGDVVCLLLPSSIDYALCYLAVARLGAITSGVNLRLGPAEQASIVQRVRPSLTVVDTAYLAEDQLPATTGAVVRRDALRDAAGAPGAPGTTVTLGTDDPVAVVWTSGTVGVPKGAVFSHRNLAAVAAGTGVLSHPADRRLSPLPFAHVAYMTRVWDEIIRAITTVITPNPWSAESAIGLLERERVSVGQGVPTQWALVLAHPDLARADLGHLRIAATGAARVPPELVRAMRTRLGCPVVVRYTSTETSLGTGTDPADPDDVVATTVGRPVPGVDLTVVDDDGTPLPAGTIGRVRLRSAAAMVGYVGDVTSGRLVDEKATAAVRNAQGWITTGDVGWVGDDGNLRLVGRAADMYIRGGYNVYPTEIEAVLGDLPGIADAAVVGFPDPVLGEKGAAFVVLAPDTPAPELEAVRAACRRRLADYKAPDRLYVVGELPVTPLGKVNKRALATTATELERKPEKVEVGR